MTTLIPQEQGLTACLAKHVTQTLYRFTAVRAATAARDAKCPAAVEVRWLVKNDNNFTLHLGTEIRTEGSKYMSIQIITCNRRQN
jgi:hypothetical protein